MDRIKEQLPIRTTARPDLSQCFIVFLGPVPYKEWCVLSACLVPFPIGEALDWQLHVLFVPFPKLHLPSCLVMCSAFECSQRSQLRSLRVGRVATFQRDCGTEKHSLRIAKDGYPTTNPTGSAISRYQRTIR